MGKFVSAMSTHQPDALRFILTSSRGHDFYGKLTSTIWSPRRTLTVESSEQDRYDS